MPPESLQVDAGVKNPSRKPRSSIRGERLLITKLVYRELLEANTALATEELHERILLPEATVQEALADLETLGLCTAEQQYTDQQPRQYVAIHPTKSLS